MPEFTLGVLDNIFVAIIISMVSFGLAAGVFRRYRFSKGSKTLAFFTIHWLAFACMWLCFAISMYGGWSDNVFVSKSFSLLGYILLCIESASLLGFLFNHYLKFPKRGLITGIATGFLALISIIILIFGGIEYQGLGVWESKWQVSSFFMIFYSIVFFIPIVIGSLIMFVLQLIYASRDKNNFDILFLIIPWPILLYSSLILLDVLGLYNGLINIFIRLGVFIGIFLIFISFFNKKIRTYNIEHGFKIKSPLIVKAIFYSIFTTVIPLIISGVLLAYSFDALVSTPQLAILSGIRDDLRLQIIITVLIIGILSFVVSIIAIKTIENRLKEIIQAMYEVLNNNFEYRIQDTQIKDEVSTLALSFNGMAQELSSYSNEINQYSELLEDKVLERTKGLEKKTLEAKKLADENKRYAKQLQQRTDIITDQMADALLVVDKSQKIIRANTAFTTIFRLKRDEVDGRQIDQIPGLHGYDDFNFMLNKMFNDKLDNFQYKLSLKPPLAGMLQCQLTSFKLSDGRQGAILLMRDITPPWGVVYNAHTMKAIPNVTVRLYNEANDKIIASETTDEAGRYTFYVPKGKYYLKSFKDEYHFPAKNPLGYHAQIVEVKTKEDGIIHFDILMDYSGNDPQKIGLTEEQLTNATGALKGGVVIKPQKQEEEGPANFDSFVKLMEEYKDEV